MGRVAFALLSVVLVMLAAACDSRDTHPDELAAYYTYEAQQDYGTPHRLQGFRGYPMSLLPANQPDAVAARKRAILLAYSAYDSHTCQTAVACLHDPRYGPWMLRTYQVSGPPSPAVGATQAAVRHLTG